MREDGKIIAAISYFTFVGWIVAFIMHINNRTSIGAYHLRQSLLLHIISMCLPMMNVFFAFIPFIGWIINAVVMLAEFALFVFWLLGLISAINGEEKPIPLVGEHAHRIFSGIN